MRLKQKEYEEARRIRREEGESVKRIAKRLGVAYSSVSMWCRDIVLTDEQNEALYKRNASSRKSNLLKGSQNMAAAYAKIRENKRKIGADRVRTFSDRDLHMLGLGLYLGDGAKTQRCTFSNSNVALQRLMISWFEKTFGLTRDRFFGRIIVHEKYRSEGEKIVSEWSEALNLPRESIHISSFLKTKVAPKYTERGLYKGTFHLTVSRSGTILHQILGMADELVYKGDTRKPG